MPDLKTITKRSIDERIDCEIKRDVCIIVQ